MAIDKSLPYVYDIYGSQYEYTYGTGIGYILTHGGTSEINSDIFNKCFTFRYSNKYQPGVYQSYGIRKSNYAYTPEEVMTEHNNGDIGVVLCAENCGQLWYENYTTHTDICTRTEIWTGAQTTYQPTVLPTARVITGQFDPAKYILVPTVTARPDSGSSITVELGTYKSQYAASYPYITGMTYRVYYKGSLTSMSTGTATDISLCGNIVYRLNLNASIMSSENSNNVRFKFTCHTLIAYGNTLYSPAEITEKAFTSLGATIRTYITPDCLLSTHSPEIQQIAFADPKSSGSRNPFYYITADTATKIARSIGFWVCETRADIAEAHGAQTVSDKVFMPQIDINGTPTGEGWTGGNVTDVSQSPIYQNWDNQQSIFPTGGADSIAANPVDIDKPTIPPENTYNQKPINYENDDLLPQTPMLNGLGHFANYYAITANELNQLNDFLWNTDETVVDEILNTLKLFGQNPINAVVSIRLYPFNVQQLLPTVQPERLLLGRVDTGVNGLKISGNASTAIDLGTGYLEPKFNNFLDYAPYSSYVLYIPFVGTINLNPNVYLNHRINIKMVVDISTGKCTAIVYCENIAMEYLDGMIGVDIPITAENMQATTNAVIQAVGNTVAAGVVTGGAGAAFAAVGGGVDVLFNDVAITKTGNVGAAGSLSLCLYPYIIRSSPNFIQSSNYAHTYGLPSNTSGKLSSYSGYTICANVDTSGIENATDDEREEIKNILESGVYI